MGVFNYFMKKMADKMPSYLLNSSYGTPKWASNKDEEYVRYGYNQIGWIYACVDLLATCGSKVDFELWRIGKGKDTKDKQVYNHAVLSMVNGQMNPSMTSKEFFYMWITYLATEGKFYANMNNTVLPTQLYPLYPHKVKPIPDKQNFVSGFEYQIASETTRYKPKEVIWSKFFDPLDMYEGLSPMKAVARTIDTENEAVNWNKAQLQNQAVPAGAIQVQNPSPEMATKLRKEWLKRYGGAKNARVPLVLNAEKANYIPFGMSPVDMDFMLQRKWNMYELHAVFGVDPIMTGAGESKTYANYEQAEQALWNETIIPKYIDRILATLNKDIVKRHDEGLELRANYDHIGAMHENMDELAKRAERLFKAGIVTQNESRYIVNFDEVDGGDKFIENPEKSDIDESKDEKKKSVNLVTEDDKELYWKSVEEGRAKYEEATQKQFKKVFEKERKEVIENVSDYKKIIKKLSTEKQNIIKAVYALVIADFGKRSYGKVARLKADSFDIDNEFIREYILEQAVKKVQMIDETTENQIAQRILLGETQGYSIPQIAELIDELYLEQIIPNRSTVIARTEVIASSNYGSLAGAKQASEDYDIDVKKIWIRTFDNRVRDTHATAGEHKPIGLDDYFQVGDSKMKFPADPNGSAEEVVNCRCAVAWQSDLDD